MSEAPTPKPPESLEEIRQELTSVPPDALNTDTVQKINVVVTSELPYAPASRFQPGKVKDIINKMLNERLGSLPAYDFEQAPAIAREIADGVKYQIRDMGLQRYKIVVQSVIGEAKDQGFQFASKSLWDPATDDYSFGSFLNDKVFGVVGAWALYLT